MFASTTWAEVVNHRFERRKRRRAVGPDIGPVGFLLAWRKHLHRCFIGVNHPLIQHRSTQRIKAQCGFAAPNTAITRAKAVMV